MVSYEAHFFELEFSPVASTDLNCIPPPKIRDKKVLKIFSL